MPPDTKASRRRREKPEGTQTLLLAWQLLSLQSCNEPAPPEAPTRFQVKAGGSRSWWHV